MNAVSLDQPKRIESPTTTILVVDDNRMVTKALSSLIREAGYAPVACHSGADALKFADGTTTPIPAKTTRVRVQAGDAVVVETSGGGGLGVPER